MIRKRQQRNIQNEFRETYFKPRGVPLRNLMESTISTEELEALRLRYITKLNQEKAAKKMGISQSQFQRDITEALEKITTALIEGHALNIKKPNK